MRYPDKPQTSAAAVAYGAVLATLALIFSYIEAIIPINIGVPGVKLGIANLVIIIALYHLSWKYAAAANLIRIIIAGLLFSGVFAMMYSLAGAILSFAGMALLKRTGIFSPVGVSAAAGVLHNFGQMMVACIFVDSIRIFAYFPVLIFTGVAGGCLIGLLAAAILGRLSRTMPSR